MNRQSDSVCKVTRLIQLTLAGLLLGGCVTSGVRVDPERLPLPAQWQAGGDDAAVMPGWLDSLHDPALKKLVGEALADNHDLAAQRALVRQAEQSLRATGATLYPELDLAFDATRSKSSGVGAGNRYELDLNLDWELDLWGRLSDSERQANLTLAARRNDLAAARLDLAADLATAWYQLRAAEQQLLLFRRRLHNLEQNLDIIESGYRLGLGSALDVYLARNDVQSERAKIEAQTQQRSEAVRSLQLLLGRYPDGDWPAQAALPVLDSPVPAGVPAQLLRRRPDLQATWMDLLASDAALAVAYKARFPRLVLSGSAGDSQAAVRDLLQGSLGWSLSAGLTQPLFNAGRLKASEEQARGRVEELQQRYLGQVFSAFSEVETALARSQSLRQQYRQYLQAQDNAQHAEELAFEQYRKGLVEYATVLEAQRRSLDAQTAVIGLRRDLLQNRVALYRGLGGGLGAVPTLSDATEHPQAKNR